MAKGSPLNSNQFFFEFMGLNSDSTCTFGKASLKYKTQGLKVPKT